MSIFLTLADLFFIGSIFGWCLELFFRRFISKANPERRWINPGFCKGPYLPLYGGGLCILYLLASLEEKHLIADPFWNRTLIFILAAVSMTVLEYIVGIYSLKRTKVRLWDYRKEWGNIRGVICPKFSLAWALLGAVYYYLVHPHILKELDWLAGNLAFSFVIGMFFGVFIIDFVSSAKLLTRLKQFAEENDVILRYEAIKTHIRLRTELAKEKYLFFNPFHSITPLSEHLQELRSSFEERLESRR